MTLLVTGASGFIGRRVVEQASAQGMAIVAAGRSDPGNLPPQVGFAQADLTDPRAAAALINAVRPTRVVHAAWETRRPAYWESETNLDWLIATAAMARAFAQSGGRRWVQVGTCASYDWTYGRCIEQVTPDRPRTRYGAAKAAAFAAIQAAARSRFEACEARIFLLYGPGEEATRFVPMICRAHLADETPAIGSGRQVRDLLHVDDVAGAVLALAQADGLLGVVNIGSGEPVTLAEVATMLATLAGAAQTGLSSRPDAAGDPDVLVPDVTRLRATGWTPRFKLRDGLARMLGHPCDVQADER